MKKCRLKMIKQSLLEENAKEIESYIGEFKENNGILTLQYHEHNHSASVSIEASSSGVEIIRNGEVNSHLMLRLQENDKTTIDSAYGQMQFDTFTPQIIKGANFLFVEYQLLQQNGIIGHFQITWNILKEEMA